LSGPLHDRRGDGKEGQGRIGERREGGKMLNITQKTI